MATAAQQKALDRLVSSGMDGFSRRSGLSAYATAGVAPRPASLTGDPGRVQRAAQSNGAATKLVFRDVASTTAWGSGSPSAAQKEKARAQFVAWVKATMPKLYEQAAQRVGPPPRALAGLGQEPTAATQSWWQKLAGSISQIGSTYLQYKTQKDLLDVQLTRAEQGLPPLETSQYAPSVQVSADPTAVRTAISAAGDSIAQRLGPLVWIVPAGIIGFMLLRK